MNFNISPRSGQFALTYQLINRAYKYVYKLIVQLLLKYFPNKNIPDQRGFHIKQLN